MTNPFEPLYRLAHALHGCGGDLRAILQTALILTSKAVGVEHGCIFEFDSSGRVTTVYGIGLATQDSSALVKHGIIGFAQHSQRIVVIRSLSTDPRYRRLPRFPRSGSAAAVPLIHEERVIGALLLLHRVEDYFNDGMVRLLEAAAQTITLALLNARQSASQQQHIEQMRHDLALMTYHDLRAPLHNIGGSIGRVSKILNGSQPAAATELLSLAQRSVGQMQRMINTLLDIDRLEAGMPLTHREPVPMGTLLLDAIDLVRPMIEDAEQRFICDCGDPLPILRVDADMILRVIANLVENAVKHTPKGGSIRISAVVTDEGVCISIYDEGNGIPAEMQNRIFDKYVRLEDAGRGVGLGLAFCRLAVESHGGRIWVESQPGAGAAFSFILPL